MFKVIYLNIAEIQYYDLSYLEALNERIAIGLCKTLCDPKAEQQVLIG